MIGTQKLELETKDKELKNRTRYDFFFQAIKYTQNNCQQYDLLLLAYTKQLSQSDGLYTKPVVG